MKIFHNKVMSIALSGAMLLEVAGAIVPSAHAQHDRHNSYRDSHGNWHRRHSGVGPGKGALIGGAAGAGIGALAGGGKGALVGGAIGAGGGAVAGKVNQNHRRDDAARYDAHGHRY